MKINVEQVKAFFGYVCGAVFAITLLSGFVFAIFGKLIASEIFVRNAKFESVEFDVGYYHASVYPASESTVDDWVSVYDCHLAKGSTLELVHTETTEYSLFRTDETSYYFVDQHGRKSSFAKGCPADKFYLRGDRDAIRKDLLNSAKRESSWMELIEHSQENENSGQATRNEHPPASKKVSDGK